MPVSRKRKLKKSKSRSGVVEQYIKDNRKYLYKTDGKGIEHRVANPTYGQKIKVYHRRNP